MPYAPKTWTTGETITAAELQALENGLAAAAPQLVPTATKAAAYTAAVGDLAVMNVAGGATALTLPTAPANKAQVGFLAVGATTAAPLTVNRGGATDTLGPSGATSVTAVLANEVTVYQYDAPNTRWLAVANVKPQAALDGRFLKTSDVSSTGTPTGDALKAAYAASARVAGRKQLEVYDDFSRYPDGNLAGLTPLLGNAWQGTGGTLPTVASGRMTTPTSGYAWQALSSKVGGITCEVVWSGSGTAQGMTMAITSGTTIDLNNLAAHFNFGPQNFNLTVRKDGGTFDSIRSGRWTRTMQVDGATAYRITMYRRGSTVIIEGPFGETFAVTDVRIAQLAGNVAFWEPGTGSGLTSALPNVAAYSILSAGESSVHDLGGALAAGGNYAGSNGQAAGSQGTAYEVAIGIDTTTNLPAITFGPAGPILATLQTAATIGATSLVTDQFIPNGSTIQIESGNGAETVTASASSSGSGPYTTTVGATTKAHAAGVAVAATVPASWNAKIYDNNGGLFVPGSVVFGAFIYLSGQTAYLTQPTAGVVGTGGAGAGKGAFQTGKGVTANRPTPAAAGQGGQWFDTTLNKPIWSNGTAWVDATGAAV